MATEYPKRTPADMLVGRSTAGALGNQIATTADLSKVSAGPSTIQGIQPTPAATGTWPQMVQQNRFTGVNPSGVDLASFAQSFQFPTTAAPTHVPDTTGVVDISVPILGVNCGVNGVAWWARPDEEQQEDVQPPEVHVKHLGEGESPFPPLPGTTDKGTTSTVGIEIGGPEGGTPCPEGYDVTEDSWTDILWKGTYIEFPAGVTVPVDPAYAGRKVNPTKDYPRDSKNPNDITQAWVWARNVKMNRVSGSPWSKDKSNLTILDHPGDLSVGKTPFGFTGTLFTTTQIVWHFKAKDPNEICAKSFDYWWCYVKQVEYKDSAVVPRSSKAYAYDGTCGVI